MRTKFIASALVTTVFLTGCADMTQTQKGTAIGAGVGAAAGAIVAKHSLAGAAIGGVVGAGAGYLWSSRMENQKQDVEKSMKGTGVEVSKTTDNQLKLYVPSDISFTTGSANLSPEFRKILDNFANSLKSNPNTIVTIIGHTDSTGSDAVNVPLSRERAARTRDHLINRGVAANRFVIDGRGSSDPVADNNTAANRAKNRRVEIMIGERPAQ